MKQTFTGKCACCMNDASLIELGGGGCGLEHGDGQSRMRVFVVDVGVQ
jgi:hypothetical protein